MSSSRKKESVAQWKKRVCGSKYNTVKFKSGKIQAVAFDKRKWTPEKARTWLGSKKITRVKRVDETSNFFRYRVENLKRYSCFSTEMLVGGINLTIMYEKK